MGGLLETESTKTGMERDGSNSQRVERLYRCLIIDLGRKGCESSSAKQGSRKKNTKTNWAL